MFFGVIKVPVPVGVHGRPQQGLCPVISLCFLSSDVWEYLFGRTYTCSMSHTYICTQKDTQTFKLSCTHEKQHSELVRQNRFFGLVTTPVGWLFYSVWPPEVPYHHPSLSSSSCLYCFVVSWCCWSSIQKFTSRDFSRLGVCVLWKRTRPVDFFTLTLFKKLKSYLRISNTVHSEK